MIHYDLDFRFFLIGICKLKFPISGWLSPNKNPKGFSGVILSKITLAIAVSGMDKNIPEIPHNAPPINTTIIEIRALIFTLLATIFGTIKLLSTN